MQHLLAGLALGGYEIALDAIREAVRLGLADLTERSCYSVLTVPMTG